MLAVADASSLAAAARRLGLNHTTVLRRVTAFEKSLGIRLFDRLPTGYALTAGGEELLAAARSMAETVTALERRLRGQDLRLEGELRVTTTDTLMASMLPAHLAAFRDRQPQRHTGRELLPDAEAAHTLAVDTPQLRCQRSSRLRIR